jgi:predicted Zn-dependent protease
MRNAPVLFQLRTMKLLSILGALIFLSCEVLGQDAQLDAVRKKMQANDLAGAKADLTKFLDSNPKNKAALNLRGQVRVGLNDYYGFQLCP